MDQFAEVLFSLNKNCFSLLAVWLKEALQPPGFPSSRVTVEQKDNFSQQILRYTETFTYRSQTPPVGQRHCFSSTFNNCMCFCSFVCLHHDAENESTSGGWRTWWRSSHCCAEGFMVQSTLLNTEILPLNCHLAVTYALSGKQLDAMTTQFSQICQWRSREMIVIITHPAAGQDMETLQHRPAIGKMDQH